MWGGEGEVEYQTFPVRRACAVVGSRRQIIIPAPVLVSNACDPSHSTTVSQPWLSMNHTWTYVLIFWISCFPLFFFVSHIHAWAYLERINIWVIEVWSQYLSLFDVDIPPGLKIIIDRDTSKGQCRNGDQPEEANVLPVLHGSLRWFGNNDQCSCIQSNLGTRS